MLSNLCVSTATYTIMPVFFTSSLHRTLMHLVCLISYHHGNGTRRKPRHRRRRVVSRQGEITHRAAETERPPCARGATEDPMQMSVCGLTGTECGLDQRAETIARRQMGNVAISAEWNKHKDRLDTQWIRNTRMAAIEQQRQHLNTLTDNTNGAPYQRQ